MIYKISCVDCDFSYVDQTKRKVKTWIKRQSEYKKIKRFSDYHYHGIRSSDHKINWDNVQVLNIEPCFHKRITSEMIIKIIDLLKNKSMIWTGRVIRKNYQKHSFLLSSLYINSFYPLLWYVLGIYGCVLW